MGLLCKIVTLKTAQFLTKELFKAKLDIFKTGLLVLH